MNYLPFIMNENKICKIGAMFNSALDLILFDLKIIIFFFFLWNHVIIFMYEELNVFLLITEPLYVFFSQFCSHFNVYLDLVNNINQ